MLLGIDLGTSSVKAAVVSDDGLVQEVASAAYAVKSPAPGRAETDPGDWWGATRKAIRSLSAANRRQVEAVGLAGQMHGVVLSRDDGAPLRPAIVWADRRADRELESYRNLSPATRRLLGNPLAAGMAGPILLWIKAHEPRVYEDARWALQPKDWLRMQLTSEAFTDPTDASATLLYDVVRDQWSREMMDELDIRFDLLPQMITSYEPGGRLIASAALELGLEPRLPVAAGAGDAAASLFGHGILDPGAVLLTIGTGAQLASIRTPLEPDPTQRTHLYRTVEEEKWYSMAAILNAGLALDWVRQLFQVDWPALYESASHIAPGAGGVTFLPYVVQERTPDFESGSGACWAGLGLGAGREHLMKAALEGVAFSIRQAMEDLVASGIAVPEIHLAGGGSVDQGWQNLLADVLGKPLIAVTGAAGSVRGAALLAGVAAGIFSSVRNTPAAALQLQFAAHPGAQADEYSDLYRHWRRALPR